MKTGRYIIKILTVSLFMPHPIDNKYMTVFLILVNAAFGMFLWTEFFVGIGAGYIFMKIEQVGIIRTIGNYF
jgi:hypothetical protein